ncbi:uncharacterized protein [Cherax quadricarinatus]|uniref:uncharacterized protein n=1 Tax=Cherax quadricarinatus TaxID=27406 RepID=UPI00387E7754
MPKLNQKFVGLYRVVEHITGNKYKVREISTVTTFPLLHVPGTVLCTVQSASLSQCASVCMMNRPQCRAFNVFFPGVAKPTRNFTCQILSGYTNLMINSYTSFYYEPDMYQRLGYRKGLGRLVYNSTLRVTNQAWNDASNLCKWNWGELLVPRSETELNWMKSVFANMSYNYMWLPIVEINELDQGPDYFNWAGWQLNTTKAPGTLISSGTSTALGNLSLTWNDDGVNKSCPYTCEDGVKICGSNSCDTKDCGLLHSNFSVTIEECGNNSYFNNVGVICEAAIPDPATYFWLYPYDVL